MDVVEDQDMVVKMSTEKGTAMEPEGLELVDKKDTKVDAVPELREPRPPQRELRSSIIADKVTFSVQC